MDLSKQVSIPTSGPDGELYYMSPSTSTSSGARARRSKGSSDDSGQPRVDEFIVIEDWRVGGPELCPLPSYFIPIPSNHPHHALLTEQATRVGFLSAFTDILDRYNIGHARVSIDALRPVFAPEANPITTVFISAKKDQHFDKWSAAAKDIYSYLFNQGIIEVSVEIADPTTNERKWCSPILQSDDIFPKWRAVYTRILNEFDVSEWTALECFRYGTDKDPIKNPPTVIVSIRSNSLTDWKSTSERLSDVLYSFGLSSTAICFMYDEIHKLNTTSESLSRRIPKDACQEGARAGLSFGIDQPEAGCGTLGGFIELRYPQKQQWLQLGLTCCHCIYEGVKGSSPAEEKCLEHWWDHPIPPEDPDAANMLKVSQPALRDLTGQIKYLDQEIGSVKTAEFEKTKANILNGEFVIPHQIRQYQMKQQLLNILEPERNEVQDFLKSGKSHLGHVYAASGFRSQKSVGTIDNKSLPSMLDWALIKLTASRKASNKIGVYPAAIDHEFIPDSNYQAMYGVELGAYGDFYRASRSTQFTRGTYGGLETVSIALQKDENGNEVIKKTLQHSIASTINHSFFALKGDSGAFVFNRFGIVVGLLYGGCEKKNTAYFMHIRDVFDDILDITGAVEVRIMGTL